MIVKLLVEPEKRSPDYLQRKTRKRISRLIEDVRIEIFLKSPDKKGTFCFILDKILSFYNLR
jgi:hypothetical protein